MKRYLLLIAVLVMLVMPTIVSRAASFTVDTTGILDNAAILFNGLFPAFVIIIGFMFGIGLIKWIVATLKSVFSVAG